MFAFAPRGGFLWVIARAPRIRTADWSSFRLRLLDTLRVWNERSRQRHDLRLLAERDDYLLKDIGLSQDEAFREADKSFWRP
jgi:uncharacterized protein YjiS (DUF1127 family)